MKRIALILLVAMLLALCACGETEAPVRVTEVETTTARLNETSATLHVTMDRWWGLGTPGSESKSLPDREVWVGDVITIEDDFLGDSSCTIEIIYIFPDGVQVLVETKGLVYAPGDRLMIYKWKELLEYSQECEVGKKSMDAGAFVRFSFS